MRNILGIILIIWGSTVVAQDNRSIDGTNNNLLHPEWNSVGSTLRYMTSTDYADGIGEAAGSDRPNPRKISNELFSQLNVINNKMTLSDYIWVFGQFLDHDISIVEDDHSSFMPIVVPEDDEHFKPGTFIPMSRSKAAEKTGTAIDNPRKVSNAVTGWIDASNIYGSDDASSFWLRSFTGGKLKNSIGNFLPFNTTSGELSDNIDPISPRMDNPTGQSDKYFVSGDSRANENPLLLSFHTIFMREHNRLCDEAAIKHPEWSDEVLYNYARKKVGAYIQAITYEEWLPEMGVNLAEYKGYFADIDANVANVFSAAAYRWGHSLVNSEIVRMDDNGLIVPEGNLDLKDGFFNPMAFVASGGVEPFLKGMGTKMHQEMDCKVIDDIRNFLFGNPNAGGLDLVSINIMRGRERGLLDLNGIRSEIGLDPHTTWTDIVEDEQVADIMKDLYGDVNNIDAWVGMLAEEHKSDALFGETIMRIMELQFGALRDGDRYYYENDDSFSDAEKNEIKNTRLYHIIMRNANIQVMQKNLFAAIPHSDIPGSKAYVIDKDLDFVLFPNPIDNDLFIKVFMYEEGQIDATIIDARGAIVFQKSLDVDRGRNVIYLGDFSDILRTGVYHLSIANQDGISTNIFVKN